MTGANSGTGLRSMPVRYLFLDEVDAYPASADDEGDPVALAEARTRTFSWRRKVFLASTPTIKGLSRIEREYEASLDFKSTDLSSEQPLGDDPLLGRGRNAQDPYRGLITDEGKIEIPLDLRGSGFWLTGLFGDPATTQTKAAGHIAFAGQPAANGTITLNGVTWTFVTGTRSSNQTQIGASLDATLTALASDLNASVDAQVS